MTVWIVWMVLRALLRQRLCGISWMDGREVPLIFSAVLTTLCSDFFSGTLELPNQMEVQLVSTISTVTRQKVERMGGWRYALLIQEQEVQTLLSPFNYWSCIKWSVQAVSYLYPQKLDAFDYLHSTVVKDEWGMTGLFFPEVDDNLLGPLNVQCSGTDY